MPDGGDGLCIWSELHRVGFSHCYLKEVGDKEYSYVVGGEVLEFELTFRVTNPQKRVEVSREDDVVKLVSNA